jgi:zinc protease
VIATAIQAHPYHWPVIGYRSDIEGVTTEKLREIYKTYFWPNNAQAILVGDFDVDDALALFDRQFGGFKRSPHPIPPVITVEPPQEGERRTLVRRPGSVGLVTAAYMRPGARHPDFVALDVLRGILADGVNSRLYQALVDKGLATSVFASNIAVRDPYPLAITATVAPRHAHAEVEAAIKAALAEIVAKGVTEAEVKRAQRQIEGYVVRRRDGSVNFARDLAEAVASADWKWFLTYVDNVKAVTAADVARVAAAYLAPEHATLGWFVPTPKGAPVVARVAAVAPPPVRVQTNAAAAPPRAAAAAAKKAFAERTVRKLLPNGLVVSVVESRAVPTVAVRGLVAAGRTAAPGDKPALPELTARMLTRGTATRSKEAIGALLAEAGANRSYAPALNEVSVQANGMARDLALLLDIVADELRNPAFREDELERARREQENAYRRANDETYPRAIERLSQLVFAKDHPYYAFGREEKIANLGSLPASDLRAFHRERYVGAGTILAIVGDVDAAQAIALVEKYFGDMPRGERPRFDTIARTVPLATAKHEVVTLRGKANMNIVMGTASGLRRHDPDFEAALVGNAVLGQTALASRIGRRVRDTEGLSYSLASRFENSAELDGLWFVNVNVAPQNLARAIASTREVIEQYAREGATDAEVEIQKNFFAGNYQIELGSNAGIASALVAAEKFGFGPKFLDEFPQRIRAVTTREVNAAMRKYFYADRLHLIVAGDLDELPK